MGRQPRVAKPPISSQTGYNRRMCADCSAWCGRKDGALVGRNHKPGDAACYVPANASSRGRWCRSCARSMQGHLIELMEQMHAGGGVLAVLAPLEDVFRAFSGATYSDEAVPRIIFRGAQRGVVALAAFKGGSRGAALASALAINRTGRQSLSPTVQPTSPSNNTASH